MLDSLDSGFLDLSNYYFSLYSRILEEGCRNYLKIVMIRNKRLMELE